MDEVLWSITENCIADLGFEDCVVYLLDASGEFMVQKAAYGPKKFENFKIIKPIKIPVGSGIVGNVANSGRAEIIPDCSLDDRYIADDAHRLSEISVPILYQGDVIGVIDSESSEKAFYTNEHLAVLSAIASLAGIRISQINRTRSLTSHRDELAQQVAIKRNELQDALSRLETANDELERQVSEKEELLRQLHHSVKNQMQMMHSLINLQSEETEDEQVIKHLRTCMNRVRCMGLAHQMATGLKIDISLYLRHLNDELNATYQLHPPTQLTVSASREMIGTERAVLLGFILTDAFVAGLDQLEDTKEPASSIDLQLTDHCVMHFDSNWWGFEKLTGLTDLFIAQLGARKEPCENGLKMSCA